MRNFENNFSNQADGGNTGRESIGDDDFERRRAERANGCYERMEKSERARASMMNKARALAMGALLAITVVSGVAASGCSTHEIMDTDHADKVETIENVESVTLTGGPNLRTDPYVTDREEPTNIIMDLGDSEQVAEISWQGEVYRYENPYDPNGCWYGFNAEEFANMLSEDNYIGQKEADRLAEKDEDGVVWVNGNYVMVSVADSEVN